MRTRDSPAVVTVPSFSSLSFGRRHHFLQDQSGIRTNSLSKGAEKFAFFRKMETSLFIIIKSFGVIIFFQIFDVLGYRRLCDI